MRKEIKTIADKVFCNMTEEEVKYVFEGLTRQPGFACGAMLTPTELNDAVASALDGNFFISDEDYIEMREKVAENDLSAEIHEKAVQIVENYARGELK